MNKKKTILIAYQYLSFKGGIEEVIYNQSKLLKKMGFSVALLASKYSHHEANTTKDSIPIYRISSINSTYRLFGIPFALPILSIRNIQKTINLIKKSDIVNVHGHPYLFSFYCIVLARMYKKPVILTQHNTKIKSKSFVMNILSIILDHTFGTYNLNHASRIIAVSRETKRYIETLADPRKKIDVVYNGVDTKRFAPTANRKALRKCYGIPENAFICFTVRRLTFKNGIETFLKTAKLSKHQNTLFLLGGTGPDKEKIQNYIQTHHITNVIMLGFIKDADLASYYALSDVFILPSIQGEGFPMVVLESFACGIPVIATKSGGHREIIRNGQNGYIVDVSNSKQIHQKIMLLQAVPQYIHTMSRNCRELAVDRFTWVINGEQLIHMCNSVLAQAASHSYGNYPEGAIPRRFIVRKA